MENASQAAIAALALTTSLKGVVLPTMDVWQAIGELARVLTGIQSCTNEDGDIFVDDSLLPNTLTHFMHVILAGTDVPAIVSLVVHVPREGEN